MPKKKDEAPETDTVPKQPGYTLQHESDLGTFVLTIGEAVYQVEKGIVKGIPLEHLAAAKLAGFNKSVEVKTQVEGGSVIE